MYEKPDHYSKRAKEEGYFARSVYKLKEIQEKFKLIKKDDRILDLGCAPGSWTQYASSLVGDNGKVVGIDYKEVKVSGNNVEIIKGNFLRDYKQEEIKKFAPFDGIISDMAPDTKGDKLADCYASSDLVKEALRFTYDFLKPDGFFIAKIFQGGEEREIMQEMSCAFKKTKWFKPESSRKKSFEIFIIGIEFIKKPDFKIENELPDLDNHDGSMPW